MAGVLQAPAEVNFFLVRKKIRIESPHFMKAARPYEQGGTAGPENRAAIVILAQVFLYRIKYPAPTKGVAPGIEPAPCSAGIFKLVALRIGKNAWLAGCNLRIGFHEPDHGLQPARLHFHIRIEQNIIISRNILQGPVVPSSIAPVLFHCYYAYLRILLRNPGTGIIRTGIIGQHYLIMGIAAPYYRRQKLLQYLTSIPVEDYDSNKRRQLGLFCSNVSQQALNSGMLSYLLNWRTALAAVAIAIVSGTIVYSQYLAKKIARDERIKVEQWAEASKSLLNPDITDIRLPFKIINDNTDIPIIETNEKDSITNFVNMDSTRVASEDGYLRQQLESLRGINPPIVYVDPIDSTKVNYYYYGHTPLLNEVRYYPLIQLLIVGLFIVVTVLALRGSYRSVQNQVWAGMAKETAHQLGTPVSSLEGWVEVMRDDPRYQEIIPELSKDVNRLRLVSDRFGKIGSSPQLEPTDIIHAIYQMVDYIRKRAPGKVQMTVHTHGQERLEAMVSPPLFDWVIENLLKNALDAMEGKGSIDIDIRQEKEGRIQIDVTDTGKGISAQHIRQVFQPGFTTKKRGWGLGLSLSKRIIVQYHRGEIFVRQSEPGKGTTFRIILPKTAG